MKEAEFPPRPNRWQVFLHMQGIGAPHPIIMRIVYLTLCSWVLVPVSLLLMALLSEAQFETLRYVFAAIFSLPPMGYLVWAIVGWHLSGKAMDRIDRYDDRRFRRRVAAARSASATS